MMNPFSATDLKRWVEENRHLYQPPYKTNRIIAHYAEFFVLVLNGPNARLDFHREPGEEFFFQIHGDIELHLKPEGEPAGGENPRRRDVPLSRRARTLAAAG